MGKDGIKSNEAPRSFKTEIKLLYKGAKTACY